MKRNKSDQDGVYNGNSAALLYFSTMIMEIVGALSRYTDMAEMLDAVVTDLQDSSYCQNANVWHCSVLLCEARLFPQGMSCE